MLLVLLIVSTLVLSSCARVRTALAVQPDDTVTGEIVLATPSTGPTDRGPVVTLPPDLAKVVDLTDYRQDDYTGTVMRFSGLTFAQVGTLTSAVGPAANSVHFELRRAGGRVLVSGAVDLTTVSVDKADFQLKVSFPGQIIDSNGDADSGTVSWTFTPGEVGDISAVVAYADPNAPSALDWSLGLGGVVALAALGVVIIARRTRNPPLSQQIR
jgi:hypothetical protein